MLLDLKSKRNEIADRIKKYDQTLPEFTLDQNILGGIAASVPAGTIAYLSVKRFNRWRRRNDMVPRIIYLAKEMSKLEKRDKLNGTGTDEPNEEMVETRDDGLKIINMPQPRTVDPKAQASLEDWRKLVRKWNAVKSPSSEDAVNDFHEMTRLALVILKEIPYKPEMMKSPSAATQ